MMSGWAGRSRAAPSATRFSRPFHECSARHVAADEGVGYVGLPAAAFNPTAAVAGIPDWGGGLRQGALSERASDWGRMHPKFEAPCH